MGGDVCAARLRAFRLVPDADDLSNRRSRDVLGVLRRDGPVNGLHFFGFHRNQHCADLLHRSRDVRRHQSVRYTTKRDLSQFGSFLMMGPDRGRDRKPGEPRSGIEHALHHRNPRLRRLTAWDTQSIKEQYVENFDAESQQKLAVFGAFSLYLNFINIFQLLLNSRASAKNDSA
jgi:Inhibitor of apoptosis-promoting Bax1